MADSKSIDLLAFCDGYPSKGNPSRNVFVHTFMKSIQRQGIKVSVIAPEPLFSFTRPNRFLASSKKFGEVDGIKVYRPMYISYSSKTLPFIGATLKLSMDSLSSAALRATKRVGDKPKIAYGHFLFSGGSCALKVAEEFSIPSVVALGESSFNTYVNNFGQIRIRDHLRRFDKIVAVSQGLKEICVSDFGISDKKIRVLKNAVDSRNFFPRDRTSIRKKLGLPISGMIGISVGSFDSRKGYKEFQRIAEHIEGFSMIYIGSGSQRPEGGNVLYAGEVLHSEVPDWLSAADVFIHPSIAEGSSNAILEAAACGLPVIARDIQSNREILDEKNAILVKGESREEFGSAIKMLMEDRDQRNVLGISAKETSEQYTIDHRASDFMEWMNSI